LHIYVFFFGFRFLVSVLERRALTALAAVTLHDAMQLVRLSKPRSDAKYSLISYFFADNRSLSQRCLEGIRPRATRSVWVTNGRNIARQMPTASASSNYGVICKFKLSPHETYHAPPLERINSSTAFAAFSNGGAAAIIITQNTTASQAKC
jgi:hypothetical protein